MLSRALLIFVVSSCGHSTGQLDAGVRADAQVGWVRWPDLPEAVSNNAVTSVETEGGCMVFSFLGMGASLSVAGIQTKGFRIRQGDTKWISLPEIPGPARLAANAMTVQGLPYLLGGYEVSSEGLEITADTLQRFNLATGRWENMASLPVPIDDTGAAAWRDRYIVTVSGWSNTQNVDAVQIYDSEQDTWIAATSFPGTPVFGQTMAIFGDELIVIDGVKSDFRGFHLVNQAWRGMLNPSEPGQITWTQLGSHPGPARYRAAGGTSLTGTLWFHGGTADPYNFDGLRYDNGEAAAPLPSTLTYHDGSFSLDEVVPKPRATMDHRGLAACGDLLLSVGGMTDQPRATAETWSIRP